MPTRRLLLAASLLTPIGSAWSQAAPWQTLPPTPAPPPGSQAAVAAVNGIRLAYLRAGSGAPVVLLHGGLANYDYWGHQIAALAPHYAVVAVDSRGHGRSTRDQRPFGYDLMADDVIALLDHLGIARADIVGWSDGGIIALDLAMRYPARVGRVFAFAANSRTDGVIDGVEKNPTFARFIERARAEYRALSPTPAGYDAFLAQISRMWATQPNWSDAQLRTIKAPTWIVDGDHDEAIKRPHTEYLATTVPGAGLLILPNVSHFAFLQDPRMFNAALLRFLAGP
ncbi:MAG: alpha/beta fold hydrolase [Reyranellaceae bacterium]